jgi:hypothetical protein
VAGRPSKTQVSHQTVLIPQYTQGKVGREIRPTSRWPTNWPRPADAATASKPGRYAKQCWPYPARTRTTRATAGCDIHRYADDRRVTLPRHSRTGPTGTEGASTAEGHVPMVGTGPSACELALRRVNGQQDFHSKLTSV